MNINVIQRPPQPNNINNVVNKDIIPCHAVDPGNRENKWVDHRTGKTKSCLSVIKPIEEYDNFNVGDVQPGSYLIEVDGDRYLIGRQAQSMGGSPVFNGNKCEKAELLILTGIEPNLGSDFADIQKLNICLPDSHNKQNVDYLMALAGDRVFKRNGKLIYYRIQKVNAIDETRDQWLCKQMGMPRQEAHIGMFNETQCKQVIKLCRRKNQIA
jgi:hypothetical protein